MPPSRVLQPEWMDRDDLDPAMHRQALRGLARLNYFSGGSAVLWSAIRRELFPHGPNTLLDVATGSGDLPLGLATRARRAGIPLAITATDKSELALSEARVASAKAGFSGEGIQTLEWVLADALESESTPCLPAGPFDIVTCSLFLHHLTEEQAEKLLGQLAARTRRLLLVNDLDRSRWGGAVVWLASRLLSRSPVVRFDGPASMGGAFTRWEASALAARSGLRGASVSWRWPCRWLLEYRPQ